MHLADLIEGIETKHIHGSLSVDIDGIAYDSRHVEAGDLFVAIKGATHNGHAFVSEALSRGARAIISEEPCLSDASLTHLQVLNSREALAHVAARFYGNPSLGLRLIGITGTNGKTTTAYILESIIRSAGFIPGVIGTINYRFGTATIKPRNTTPESLEIQQLLSDMKEEKVSHVVMEVSSHALDQNRVKDVHFDVGVFTNLTVDHLDYHKTMEHYAQSKAKLFSRFLEQSDRSKQKYAVINYDDPFAKCIESLGTAKTVRYGMSSGVDVTIEGHTASLDGISGRLKTFKGNSAFSSPLLGNFNLYNVMAAAAAALTVNIPLDAVCAGIETLSAVPGRLERVGEDTEFTVLVDYAHTPDALEKTLASVRDLGGQRTITVFGCGGNRDRSKRPVMGRIAGCMSDIVIVTSDNPRYEDPEQIIAEIVPGLTESGMPILPSSEPLGTKGYLVIEDRREAIAAALTVARHGDVVVVAGKGHEDYQIVGTETLYFDDREVIKELLDRDAGCRG
jgi:UDP-N-acetylmuramoyl-L-alanyl-D-glutamate--2,6-diaminopimelate ligase